MLKLELEKLFEIQFKKYGVFLTDRFYKDDVLNFASRDDLIYKDGFMGENIYESIKTNNHNLTEFQLERDLDYIPFFRREVSNFNGYDFSYEVYSTNKEVVVNPDRLILENELSHFGITISPLKGIGFIYIWNSCLVKRVNCGKLGVEITDELFDVKENRFFKNESKISELDAIRRLDGEKLNNFKLVRVVTDFLRT